MISIITIQRSDDFDSQEDVGGFDTVWLTTGSKAKSTIWEDSEPLPAGL
jgi:hypothetical protein